MKLRILFIILFLVMAAGSAWARCQYNDTVCQSLERIAQSLEQQQAKPQPVFNQSKPYDINIQNPGESFMDGYRQGLEIKIKQEQLKQLRRQNAENN